MALAALPRHPRRDAEARDHLEELGRHARPVVLARERVVALGGGLAELVPHGALVRGTVLRVVGEPGTGSTAVAFELAAAVTELGEWAAAVDLHGTLGALAAHDAGVALERFAVVRRVPPARWATVVAALLEGVSLVIAEVPPHGVRVGDARRLVARAREREAVLVAYEGGASGAAPGVARWPAEVALTLRADGCTWEGDAGAADFLAGRRLHVQVEGRGAAAGPRIGELARAG